MLGVNPVAVADELAAREAHDIARSIVAWHRARLYRVERTGDADAQPYIARSCPLLLAEDLALAVLRAFGSAP